MFSLRKLAATVFASGLALVLPGCATNLYAPDPQYVAPAMWKVADKDTTIYLFGTVHALSKETAWYGGPIEQAYESSDELVTEIKLGDPVGDATAIVERAALPAGENLRDLMTVENRAKYEETLVSLGLPVDAMDKFEPWYAAMTLSLLPVMQKGFDPQSGADTELAGKAEGKQLAALENVNDQIDIFDGLPMDAQLTFLAETVGSVGQAADELNVMVGKWLQGDAKGLAAVMNEELDDPVLYSRLLTQRNARWADWIKQRMEQPGTVFVAVGAGHLAGKGSVQDVLQKRGVKVTRVRK
ncbi:TraB/GumN family protein [Altererythrobacter salegens]|uniref:TraB/GumN family protein n=1 Tax=Croceibacterium salegens TaxID=1737568 RepID=A0A6I4SWD0_9SPHN|nr:TraB/GumN family protein [Croceibacterium salegens]MXO59649.1 TraB/GumN family protein [Croceibacterium salegens]